MKLHEKAYLLYTNEAYLDLAELCVTSIQKFSDIPIIVYGLNFQPEIKNVTCRKWDCDIIKIEKRDDFINRADNNIYKLLIERPRIVCHALTNYAKQIAYVDTDSIASPNVDNIFNYFDNDSSYPFFTEGIYDYLHIGTRGGADSREDMSGTLEAPICELFGINQYVRQRYRQTGYFVAGQNCKHWLQEWAWMCQHPSILRNNAWYAPFHEETIANALLWKYNQFKAIPYCYINGLRMDIRFIGIDYLADEWLRIPAKEEHLLFYHGEKNVAKINEFINYLK